MYLAAIIITIIYSVILNLIYFLKKHSKTYENNLYSMILFTNLIGLILEFICIIFKDNFSTTLLINNSIIKFYIIYLYTFLLLVSEYLNYLLSNKKYNIIKYTSLYIYIICITIMLILPLNITIDYTFICTNLCILIWLISIILNIKKIKLKKFIPIFFFIILWIILSITSKIYYQISLIATMEFLIIFIMYFTIENPNAKLITKLNLAKEQAEKASNAKNDFLSSMSHEIRTPLNAIVGLCEDIAINDELPESMKEDVEDILSSSHTLLEIVGNIMDINKIESNKIELNETTYNIRQEIENIFKLNSSRIGNKEIDYRINIDSNIPNKLIGDKNYINQILNNLLSNAIKYTDKGIIELNINCKIKKEKCILTIIVKDTGKGIKQENINKIFNKFERLDIEPNTTIEGSGLGLSITQKLVELMEGEINVKSTYGKGSIFIITIPQKIPTKIKELTDNQIIRLNNISDEFNDKKDKWSNVEKHIIVDSTNKER